MFTSISSWWQLLNSLKTLKNFLIILLYKITILPVGLCANQLVEGSKNGEKLWIDFETVMENRDALGNWKEM